MGTGQMLITIGAIVLLGTVILTTNRGINNSDDVMMKTDFGLEGTAIAASVIDEAMCLPFDDSTGTPSGDSTIYTVINSTSRLTPVTKLGYVQGSGEDTLPDDFGDFNGLQGGSGRMETIVDSTGTYKVLTRVFYVTKTNLNQAAPSPTWFKRLDVSVWNVADTADVIKMSAIYAYWYFR